VPKQQKCSKTNSNTLFLSENKKKNKTSKTKNKNKNKNNNNNNAPRSILTMPFLMSSINASSFGFRRLPLHASTSSKKEAEGKTNERRRTETRIMEKQEEWK
jgi:hypothetical protein